MATKTGITGKLKVFLELFDDDAAAAGENFNFGQAAHVFETLINVTNGTSDGQMNLAWSDRATIAASATTTIDLAGGITDSFGHTLTFTVVKLLIVRNRNTTTGDILHVGTAASTGWAGFWADATDRTIVKPGITSQPSFVILYDPVGIAVTAGSADDLVITEVGGANTGNYDIFIAGEGTYT